MYPLTHIVLSLILAIILKLLTALSSIEILIILLAAILIDIDHWFVYIFKKKDFNISRAYSWFIELDKQIKKLSKNEREKYKSPMLIFHGIEFWILLLILSFYSKIFIFILIGIAVHMLLDYIDLFMRKGLFYAKFSQVYTFIKNKDKKEFY